MSAFTVRPVHLAIIMDGNGRWAARRGRPRTEGHRAGKDALERIVRAVAERNIPILTIYAFSSENWNRPRHEIRALMELFRHALEREVDELDENGVRLNFIGSRSSFSPQLRRGMAAAEQRTRGNTRLLLNVAVNYGGQWDLLEAARQVGRAARDGVLDPEQLDVDSFARMLSLGDQPPPDLFIRTGGEKRLSNFLLWQLAYTEFYFSDVLWPDFKPEHLDAALADFATRERRFGGLGRSVRHA